MILRVIIILSILVTMPQVCIAQNPIIRDQFTADPTARVFNNKVYLYPSHDIKPPTGQRQDWFCMEDYHVFSSENLTEWTDHGIIISQEKVPWVKPNSYSMWAPDCVERNGKYYFYFASTPKVGSGFNIGIAIADHPEGPFTPEPEPIKGINGIDPCVLQASDGNAYIFWGNGRCAKLKPNMKELADDNPKSTVKYGNREVEMVGVNCLEGLPNRQAEGPFAFEANGWYYLTYPYVRENTEVLGYAMSKNPMGPYEYKGLIMAEQPNGCWTNHHSIINYKGQWYLFYHHNYFSPNDDKRRSACIEKLYFNPDGTIQEVKQTMRGVGINDATKKIEIDRFSTASRDVTVQLIDTTNTFRGFLATLPEKGSWLKYNDVDFSNIHDGKITICAKANNNTKLYIREKSRTGKVIAKIDIIVTNKKESFSNKPNQWLTLSVPLDYTPKGVSDIVITAEGTGIDVDWIQFEGNKTQPPKTIRNETVPELPTNNNSPTIVNDVNSQPIGIQSQKLVVESLTVAEGDLSASVYERLDITKKPCALLKVALPLEGVLFEGNVLGNVENKGGEYWVYLSEGTKDIQIKHPMYNAMKIYFSDYGIKSLEGKVTYLMTIHAPQKTQKLVVNYTPKDALVLVDSKPYQGNGHLEIVLPVGTHSYVITKVGYVTAEGSVKLNADYPRRITETLDPVK